jgi:FAD/FMN-containing dehydrogenase/pimeloyl-ACP methyl ester carboxylesterase
MRDDLLEAIPVSERRLVLAGISTAVLEGGEGPPLVLLHGPGGNAAHWMRVIPGLVAGNRVIAPDLPGQGGSTAGEDALDAERVLAWLGDLIEQTCPSRPVLVGFALGGGIAARYAIEHGDRLGRLVLVDALGLVAFEPAPQFGRALHEFLAQPTESTHDGLWRHCALDLDALRADMDEQWEPFRAYNVDRAATPSVRAALEALMRDFGVPAIEPAERERIAVPTALIWGRHDLATPLAVAKAACTRFGWPLHVIEDSGDDPPIEQPEAFLRALSAEALRERLDGALLTPSDAGFGDATRLWNGMIEKTPAFVVRATGTTDVVAAVDYARERSLPLSVRGGGHNIAGTALADRGVTIDMSLLRDVVVEPDGRTATVQPGCTLADVDRATQAHGLATTLGFISEVGVAGLTLGGGLGYLARRFGWTVDNLLEVEIVTADGQVRRAGPDEHEDLFWAIRGAGANLGVVTSFTYRLHEVGPTVFGGVIAWPFARAEEILRAYREITVAAPRELSVWLNIFRAPPAPFVPEAWHGERVCAMVVCFTGDLERADEVVAPIRAIGNPILDLLAPMPYGQLQSSLDDMEPKGRHYYWRTEYLPELTDDFLETLRELAQECPTRDSAMAILHLGGAIADRDGDDGAVGNRDARYACGALGMWEADEPGADGFPQWIRDAWERFRPFSTGGNYVNLQTADEGEDRIRATYGDNFDRVLEVKQAYDPDNLFRSNRNIRPVLAQTR